jgi:hypothetical protein
VGLVLAGVQLDQCLEPLVGDLGVFDRSEVDRQAEVVLQQVLGTARATAHDAQPYIGCGHIGRAKPAPDHL